MGGQAAEPSNLLSHGPDRGFLPGRGCPPLPGCRLVTGRTRAVRMRALPRGPRLPLRVAGIRLERQVQRLDVGRWTGPQVFLGERLLKELAPPLREQAPRQHLLPP
jgi:hypothetical protein